MIDVAFTPQDLRRADVAVVVDVLRATSTVTQALAAGFGKVVCVATLEAAALWRAPGRVLAGERNCVRPPGFELGNSPREIPAGNGELLVLATTNGAPTVVAAGACAGTVLLGCLLNLAAVLAAVRHELTASPRRDVQIVCSGTEGAVAVEDVYVAGRICAALSGQHSDGARVAEAVARAYPSPLEALAASANASVLRAAGLGEDIAYCARESSLHVVPRLATMHSGAAILVEGVGSRPDGLTPAMV